MKTRTAEKVVNWELQLILLQLWTTHVVKTTALRNFIKHQKIWISAFAWFLTTIVKNSFLDEGLGAEVCLHPALRFQWCVLTSKDFKSGVVQQLVRELICNVYYRRYQLFFYLWRTKAVLERTKLRKYYNQGWRVRSSLVAKKIDDKKDDLDMSLDAQGILKTQQKIRKQPRSIAAKRGYRK